MIFNRNNTVATQQGMKTYWLWYEFNFLYSEIRGRILSSQESIFALKIEFGGHSLMMSIKFMNFMTPIFSFCDYRIAPWLSLDIINEWNLKFTFNDKKTQLPLQNKT